jgi:hypothetical protein
MSHHGKHHWIVRVLDFVILGAAGGFIVVLVQQFSVEGEMPPLLIGFAFFYLLMAFIYGFFMHRND